MTVLVWLLGGLTLLFTARRSMYWVASFGPMRQGTPSRTRSVVVVVPARNEEETLPRLLAALERLDYPAELLNVVLVDDASTDGTAAICGAWASSHRNRRVLHLTEPQGKGAALAAAVAVAPPTELVAVFDADTEPAPDALAWLAGAFDDSHVGAAGGYARPGNAERTITSRYAALERWVCHLVTLAGKDRLGQDPPVLGAVCAFRRSAFDHVGPIPADAISEDVWISMALTARGWRTRWIGRAVAREDVAEDLETFWRQRIRWSRGQLATRRVAGRVEDFFVAAGYLDRLVFAVTVAFGAFGRMPLWIPAAYAIAPVATMVTAARRARVGNVAAYLAAAVAMVAADFVVTAVSAAAQLRGRPHRWTRNRAGLERGSKAA